MNAQVLVFFSKIKGAGAELVYDEMVILAVIKLLSVQEKKFLFSLVLNKVKTERITFDLGGLEVLEMVRKENGYYTLDERLRGILLNIFTKKGKYVILEETEALHQVEEDKTYSRALFKSISNGAEHTVISKLMVNKDLIKNREITHKGFNFLLSTRKSQLWTLILAHIDEVSANSAKGSEVFELLCLCEILSKNLQREYLITEAGHKTQILAVFKSLGILSQAGSRVAFKKNFELLFDESYGQMNLLILESNFRMYIYGQNELNIFITSLFTHKVREFPNLVISTLNEESLKKAFVLGITSKQVIEYLSANSFYQVNANVLEQIEHWEKRRKRIDTWGAYLFNNFLNFKDFLKVETFCDEQTLKYESYKDQRVVVVDVKDYESVKNFIKANIK
ncbi:transcription initiation factor TFIIH subunit 4 [Nematocida displodere]|uniref:RNA polymerase II transcription factor B subunit 2 n=1 Tax=Nematocida displodere TaxID=1805483 RepID=A0A177EA56_9MICR|nr:transcription initiation factor TFIIH subunit 4 [Nematocida displodere]